ncbi:MAG: glycerophosphodiester phosphodiesterase family protein [Lachnospiraceae bacterium]
MLRIGMIGTGRIAQRFVKDILMTQDAMLTCVYNPHESSADKFVSAYCKDYGVEKSPIATMDLNVLWNQCDAVYIATPHETHYLYAKAALEAGKHVLCEKPMTLVLDEAEELFALAKEKGLVLREAVKTSYCPGFLKLLEVAQSGVIGEICDVEAAFTKLESTCNRELMEVKTGGSVAELGAYCMLPIFKLMGWNYSGVQAQSIHAPNGVDKYTKLIFTYENGMATAKMGLGVKSEGQLLISGTKGYILAESPWWLTKKFEVRYEDPNRRERYEFDYLGAGLIYEIIGFIRDCEGEPIGAGVTEEETLSAVHVIEQFLQADVPLRKAASEQEKAMVGIWAHRGMCMKYPQNTLLAFEEAAKIPGVKGIELDVQLSKEGRVVVFHDETLGRITTCEGRLCDYTLEELQQIPMRGVNEELFPDKSRVRIPTLEEVLKVLKPYCEQKNLLINIELKTSVIHYEGIEEKTLELVKKYNLEAYIIYSSFWAESVKKMKELDASCKTGMLATKLSDCIKWGDYANAEALHPSIGGLDCAIPERWQGKPVRAWNGIEAFFPEQKPQRIDLREFSLWGVTDVFTNDAEIYE